MSSNPEEQKLEKPAVIAYWRKFFVDLLVGTVISIILFGIAGFSFGIATATMFAIFYVLPLEISGFLEWMIIILATLWLAILGGFHGLVACFIKVVSKKMSEMVLGLHDLLDILVSEVMFSYIGTNEKIPKKELAEKFDNVGNKFLEDLKLKKGMFRFMYRIIFSVILKVLKFIFLDDVVEELRKRKSDQLGKSDIESAIRRVGVEFVVSSIKDNLIILHVVNGVLMLITLSIPFLYFWFF